MTNDDRAILTAQMQELINANAKLEEEMGERVDPGDFFGMIQMIADSEDSFSAFLETRLYKDLLHFTQSNPARTDAMIREWAKNDDAISVLDDEIMDLD